MRIALRFALAALLVSSALSAQVKETINVNVVEVPVTVVDRGGNPVRGLTAKNFELLDNGTRRDITSFDAIDFASGATSTSPLNPAARRTFLLLFDLSFATPATIERAQEAARHFIARNVQRRDLIAVASVDPDKGFRVLTSFTTDRNLVAAAVADPHSFRGNDPLQIADLNLGEAILSSSHVGLDQQPVGKDQDQAYDLKLQQDVQDLEFRRHKIELQLGALEALAKTLRNVPGRKEVVLLSEGFDPSVLRGRDVRATAEQH